MAGRNRGNAGDKAVAYLAIAFVLAAGVGFGSITIVAFSPNPMRAFVWLGGAVFSVLVLVWLFRDNKEGISPVDIYRGLLGLRQKKQKVKIKIKRIKKPRTEEAPDGPPTVERIRKLSSESSTWVPSARSRNSPHED